MQINSILNVGESAYSQIQKLKGQDDPQELNYKANVKVMICCYVLGCVFILKYINSQLKLNWKLKRFPFVEVHLLFLHASGGSKGGGFETSYTVVLVSVFEERRLIFSTGTKRYIIYTPLLVSLKWFLLPCFLALRAKNKAQQNVAAWTDRWNTDCVWHGIPADSFS